MNRYEYKYVTYHSNEWEAALAAGWFTMDVDEQNIARMAREIK